MGKEKRERERERERKRERERESFLGASFLFIVIFFAQLKRDKKNESYFFVYRSTRAHSKKKARRTKLQGVKKQGEKTKKRKRSKQKPVLLPPSSAAAAAPSSPLAPGRRSRTAGDVSSGGFDQHTPSAAVVVVAEADSCRRCRCVFGVCRCRSGGRRRRARRPQPQRQTLELRDAPREPVYSALPLCLQLLLELDFLGDRSLERGCGGGFRLQGCGSARRRRCRCRSSSSCSRRGAAIDLRAPPHRDGGRRVEEVVVKARGRRGDAAAPGDSARGCRGIKMVVPLIVPQAEEAVRQRLFLGLGEGHRGGAGSGVGEGKL